MKWQHQTLAGGALGSTEIVGGGKERMEIGLQVDAASQALNFIYLTCFKNLCLTKEFSVVVFHLVHPMLVLVASEFFFVNTKNNV
jgi:hypothetical protein